MAPISALSIARNYPQSHRVAVEVISEASALRKIFQRSKGIGDNIHNQIVKLQEKLEKESHKEWHKIVQALVGRIIEGDFPRYSNDLSVTYKDMKVKVLSATGKFGLDFDQQPSFEIDLEGEVIFAGARNKAKIPKRGTIFFGLSSQYANNINIV